MHSHTHTQRARCVSMPECCGMLFLLRPLHTLINLYVCRRLWHVSSCFQVAQRGLPSDHYRPTGVTHSSILNKVPLKHFSHRFFPPYDDAALVTLCTQVCGDRRTHLSFALQKLCAFFSVGEERGVQSTPRLESNFFSKAVVDRFYRAQKKMCHASCLCFIVCVMQLCHFCGMNGCRK